MIGEIVDWMRRARQLVPREDRKVLLSPPRLVARFAGYAWKGNDYVTAAEDIGARDPEFISLMLDFFRVVAARYFRLRVEGIDNVPRSGPVLLVGNHNGGLLPSDGFFAALAIRDRFGAGRGFYVLAHDFLFHDPVLRSYAHRLGMLRASPESAQLALAAGACVLVYPGSDLDTFRTFRDRGKIVLGQRTGFVRLALRERVPIVPVVSSGTHEQLIVLARGDRLARLLRAEAWARTEVLPFVFAVPWGLTSGFVPYLPLPAQTTIAFGAPITWPELGSEDAQRRDVVDRCYREVESTMQSMLDRLEKDRRFLLGPRKPKRPRREASLRDSRRERRVQSLYSGVQ